MATKKRKVTRKRRVVRKTVRKRRIRKVVRKSPRKRKATVQTVSHLKARIRKKVDDQLKDALFKRDKATTYRAHRAAQKRIDNARRELRRLQ